jgi:hypothetical protein
LLLLQPKDAKNIPESLSKNINNLEPLVKQVVLSQIRSKKLPDGVDIQLQSYGTTTPVDIGE